MGADRHRPWPLRVLRNPIAAALLLYMLAMDACTLPRGVGFAGRSTVGEFFGPAVRSERYIWSQSLFLRWNDGDPIIAGSAWEPLDDDPATKRGEQDRYAGAIYYPHWPSRYGFWAVTRDRPSTLLRIFPSDDQSVFSEEEVSRMRRAIVEKLIATDGPTVEPLLGAPLTGEPEYGWTCQYGITRILWSGYVHNAIALFIALALADSLFSAPEWREWWYRRRHPRAAALKRGRCPKCGYDITGLPAPTCPECGEDLTPNPA